MTLVQFQEILTKLDEQIQGIENQKEVIISTYIAENAKFKKGNLVEFAHGKKVLRSFIDYPFLHWDNMIRYKGFKVKIDGTPSYVRLMEIEYKNETDFKIIQP